MFFSKFIIPSIKIAINEIIENYICEKKLGLQKNASGKQI